MLGPFSWGAPRAALPVAVSSQGAVRAMQQGKTCRHSEPVEAARAEPQGGQTGEREEELWEL